VQQRSGPEGYTSNYAAILDVLRFGFGIWSPLQMAALLFHIERSTAYGWTSDQHSQSQVMAGCFSKDQRRWIRGPAGISRATLNRANAELEKAGALQRFRRKTRKGGDAATEYIPDWIGIRAAIQQWQDAAPIPVPLPLFDAVEGTPSRPNGPQGGASQRDRGVSHTETGGASHRDTGVSHTETGACLTQRHTVVSSLSSDLSQSVARARDVANPNPNDYDYSDQNRRRWASQVQEALETASLRESAGMVAEAIETAWGGKLLPDSPIPGELLAIAQRLGLPAKALVYWAQDFAREKRASGYPMTSPRLFVRAAGSDLVPWARTRGTLISALKTEELNDAARQGGALVELPAAPVATTCPVCKKETLYGNECSSPECLERRTARKTAGEATRRTSGM
jgi:hypothetical protein